MNVYFHTKAITDAISNVIDSDTFYASLSGNIVEASIVCEEEWKYSFLKSNNNRNTYKWITLHKAYHANSFTEIYLLSEYLNSDQICHRKS